MQWHTLEGEMPNLRESEDDGEIGAGARMLSVMEKQGVTQMAVFVVRYTGQELGMRCFDIISDLVEQVCELLEDADKVSVSKWPKSTTRLPTPKAVVRGGNKLGRGGSHSVRGITRLAMPGPAFNCLPPPIPMQALPQRRSELQSTNPQSRSYADAIGR